MSTTLDPRWLSSTVLDLARAIIAKNQIGALPILGDALMDSGCDDESLLNHCRTKRTLPLPIAEHIGALKGHAMPFGKYKGRSVARVASEDRGYLVWMLAKTDVAETKPELTAAIKTILDYEPTLAQTVRARRIRTPQFGYSVRGGGSMHDGMNWCARLTLVNGELARCYMATESNLSGSGRSGSVDIDEPTDDGCYEWVETSGSIANHDQTPTVAVLHEGEWFELNNRNDAMAILRGAKLELV